MPSRNEVRSFEKLNICAIVNTNKGKAYIDFETQEDADKAISYMDNVSNRNSPLCAFNAKSHISQWQAQLDGKRIVCVVAPKHRERSPSPRRGKKMGCYHYVCSLINVY